MKNQSTLPSSSFGKPKRREREERVSTIVWYCKLDFPKFFTLKPLGPFTKNYSYTLRKCLTAKKVKENLRLVEEKYCSHKGQCLFLLFFFRFCASNIIYARKLRKLNKYVNIWASTNFGNCMGGSSYDYFEGLKWIRGSV